MIVGSIASVSVVNQATAFDSISRSMRNCLSSKTGQVQDRESFPNHSQAKLAVFEYIEGWYNPHCRHSAIKYQSPITYEKLMAKDDGVESSTLSTKAMLLPN